MPGHRLAPHVVVEPLVGDFTAWWCNVAPLTGAMHTARYVLPTLEAYLEDPEVSYESALEPSLLGGPFVGVPPEHAERVREVAETLEREYADGLRLAEAVHGFSERLLEEAKGQSLEPFYALCPEELRGRVELVYDYHNRPSIRFDEGTLYRSSLHKRHLQGVRLFEHTRDGGRSFYVSTPHVPDAEAGRLRVPFADERIRRLVRLDVEPRPLAEVQELLGDPALHRFVAEGPPRVAAPHREPKTKVSYVGHATVLVQHGGASVLFDPFVPTPPRDGGVPRLGFDDLPAHLDFVAVTHIHTDHFFLESLLRLAPRIGTLLVPRNLGLAFGDVSMRRVAQELGIASVVEVDTFDTFRAGDLELVVAPFYGEHGDLAHGSKATFLVRAGKDTMYFAADSAALDDRVNQELLRVFGSVESVFMNTETEGAPLSWPFDGLFPRKRNRALEATRRCRGSNYEEGLRLVEVLEPKRLFNYAMGIEPWLEFVLGPASGPETTRMQAAARLLASARERGIEATRLQGSREIVLA